MEYSVKIKEIEKINKYQDAAREREMSWTMKVTVIPMVVNVFEIFPKSLENRMSN